nr:trypsin-7-like [Cherax quadricarinatus]
MGVNTLTLKQLVEAQECGDTLKAIQLPAVTEAVVPKFNKYLFCRVELMRITHFEEVLPDGVKEACDQVVMSEPFEYQLKDKLQMGKLVQPLQMPPEGESVVEGTVCTVIGWGITSDIGDITDILQKADVAEVSDENCRISYGEDAVEDSMLCAGWSDGHADACDGDQGGPLLCWGHLHGIASWGENCGDSFYPGVYTEIAFFRNWILNHINPPMTSP